MSLLVLGLVLVVALYAYVLAIISLFERKSGDARPDDLFFVLLVPALNEQQVIGSTLTSLLKLHGDFLVLVIDDASDDGTVAAITPFLHDPRVRLLQQPPERARRGKGHALNAGYAAARDLGLSERYGSENVIITVFDSDARVDPNFLQAVAPYFSDSQVVGVQSAVRIYNADRNLLTLWQNLEFTVWGNVFGQAKNLLGSASLGGNGQCVRLAALTTLGDEPWQAASLTEDLDLSLRLLVGGWQLRFCPSTTVWQEAVPELGKLVRQRSRWVQGHLVCWRYLPDLWRSRLPLRARLDLCGFLLLPATILPVGLASLDSWAQFLLHFGEWGSWSKAWYAFGVWYFLGFVAAQLVVMALPLTSWRSLPLLVLRAHVFTFYSFVWFLATLAACQQVLLGRRTWAKTARVTGLPKPTTATSLASEKVDIQKVGIHER
jgi:cellulose synthase/poly-beta-1,6-N-acetylglucosamine synthase-like glycosyltransferase